MDRKANHCNCAAIYDAMGREDGDTDRGHHVDCVFQNGRPEDQGLRAAAFNAPDRPALSPRQQERRARLDARPPNETKAERRMRRRAAVR